MASRKKPNSPGGGTSQALEIDRRLGFTYPHAEAQEIRSKYSVSSLNRKAHTPAVSMSDSTDDDYQGGENTFKEDRKNIGIPKEQPKKGLRNGSGEATLPEPEFDGEKVAEIGFEFSLPVPGFFQGNADLSAAERGSDRPGSASPGTGIRPDPKTARKQPENICFSSSIPPKFFILASLFLLQRGFLVSDQYDTTDLN